MFWQTRKFLEHQFFIRHRKGRGIHSPYLFEFVHNVLFNAAGPELPDWLARAHRELRQTDTGIPPDRISPKMNRGKSKYGSHSGSQPGSQHGSHSGSQAEAARMETWGAGSRVKRREGLTVGSFVRGSSVSPKYGALLYRISRWFAPEMIVELGTGVGVSTLYLSAGSPGVPLHSMEGDTEKAAIAAQLMCRYQQEQVSIHWGDIDRKLDDLLPLVPGKFLAFLDANHRYEPTLEYVSSFLERVGEESILVMDDIYWLPGMYRAWNEVIHRPEVRMSIDLYRMGILLLRKDLQKLHVKINF